jgi:hypothetical protein
MLAGVHKTQRMVSASTFFGAIPQRWRCISQSHRTINRWWNLSFICEWWNQRAVNAVDAHTHSLDKTKNFKHMLSATRKLMATVFWDRKGVMMVQFMQIREHDNVRSVMRNTKIAASAGHSEQKAWNADIRCSALPWQCASAYSYSHSSTLGAFHLVVVWLPFLQPWSRSKRLPPVTYLKNWLRSQLFSNNEKLTEGAKTWLSSQEAATLTQAYKNSFPDTTNDSIATVTMLRSS